MDNKSRIILIDSSILMFRGIHAWNNAVQARRAELKETEYQLQLYLADCYNDPERAEMLRDRILWLKENLFKVIPATWIYLASLIANLKRVGLTKEDKVIIAVDSKHGSWRKKIEKSYKGNRKAKRQSFPDIDWEKMFSDFNKLLNRLKYSTPFKVIVIKNLEADDVISVSVRYFKDQECIIVSYDKDFEQLLSYPNVKIFSPKSKKYKFIKDPYKSLAQKIRREASDNLITPILNEKDYEKRRMIVSLLELPEWVEKQVRFKLSQLDFNNGQFNIQSIPFQSIQKRINTIYKKNKVVNYEKCLEKFNNKNKKKGKKK